MEASIKREDLLRGLYLVQGVVERRSTLPILANVLLEPAEGGLAITATDLEVGLRTLVAGDVKSGGAITLGARKLYEIVREIAAEELVIRAAGAGWVEIIGGRSKFKVVSLDARDFPQLPLGPTETAGVPLRVAAGTLREMIDKTIFAVSTDETRFNLSGVYVEGGENHVLRMVATDGHRLAMVERNLGETLSSGAIMPRKGLNELRKLLEDTEDAELTLTVADKNVRVQTAAVSSFMRIVEGEFPDYRQVIPSTTKVKARMNRDDFLAALRRISLLASERSHGVRLHLERGRLEISASNPEQGEATEDIEVSYPGEPLSIGFNARYLLDVLGVHAQGDVIEFGLTDEVGPGVLRGSQDPGYTYVVMPMRL